MVREFTSSNNKSFTTHFNEADVSTNYMKPFALYYTLVRWSDYLKQRILLHKSANDVNQIKNHYFKKNSSSVPDFQQWISCMTNIIQFIMT